MAREKQQITITLDPILVEWLDKMIDRHVFANRSHGVEACISIAKEHEFGLFPSFYALRAQGVDDKQLLWKGTDGTMRAKKQG
jgi:hypothetical protein